MPAFPSHIFTLIPNTTTIFRLATHPDCHPIYKNCTPPHSFSIFKRGFHNALQNYGTYPLVGELNGNIVASGQLVRMIGYAEIAELVVAPQQRGQGIGTALVAVLLQMATFLDMPRVEIGVNAGNFRAFALYQKLGFVENRQINIPNQSEPAIILSKTLKQ